MRLKITIAALALAIGILPMQAQQRGAIKTHTEKDTRKISDGYDRVPCTETYSYYEDESGNYVKHGSYSISGTKELKRSDYLHSLNVSTSYSAKANFNDGWLNGTVTVNMSMLEAGHNKGQNFSIKTVHSYIGNYSDGLPHGSWTFKTTQNGKVIRNISVNFKNGLLAGSYYSYFDGDELKGQFDANGQMNGDWARNDNFRNDTKSKYIKGLQLSSTTRDSSGKVTKSTDKEETQFATLYANGGISEEELNAKSCYIIDRSTSFQNMYREFYVDILNLKVIGGYKIATGSEEEKANFIVQYKAAKKLNMIPNDLFEAVLMAKGHVKYDKEYMVKFADMEGSYGYACYQDFDTKLYYIGISLSRGTPHRKFLNYFLTPEQTERYNDLVKLKELQQSMDSQIKFIVQTRKIFGDDQYNKDRSREHVFSAWQLVRSNTNYNSVSSLDTLFNVGNKIQKMVWFKPNTKIVYSKSYNKEAEGIDNYTDAVEFFFNEDRRGVLMEETDIYYGKLDELETKLDSVKRQYENAKKLLFDNVYNRTKVTYRESPIDRALNIITNNTNETDLESCEARFMMYEKAVAIANSTNGVDFIDMAKSINNYNSAMEFFAMDMEQIEKLFTINKLYGQGIVSYSAMFKPETKYTKKTIVNLFIIVKKECDKQGKAGEENLSKVMDVMIELYPKNSKNAEKLAKKITTYDEAVDFFLNKALDSCAK